MLFQMRATNNPIYGSEIYVIVTVSATLIEDLRKVSNDYYNRRAIIELTEN